MSSVYKHKQKGGWYCAFVLPSRTRRQVYLGNLTKAGAQQVAKKIDMIIAASHAGTELDASIHCWLALCSDQFRNKLTAAGLLAKWQGPASAASLSIFWDSYIEQRTDFAESSRKGFGTAKKHAIAFFGDRNLTDITVADAKLFSRRMESTFASAHAKKIVERTKQVLQHAVDARLIQLNPFAGIQLKAKLNKTRGHYLPEKVALQILDKLGTVEAKTVFVLARFAGLRVPHEPLSLTWSHIDFEKHRITIPESTKTGLRVIPMVPIVYSHLLTLAEKAGKSPWVLNQARASAATNYRRWLESAILLAGLQQWPKLWHNLRASCRTDWEEQFSSHVCDAWLGHSLRVAKDHYLQVTEEHWKQATKIAAHSETVPK